jgi:UDP-N-acetylglucosamine 2-epimerase (non-hydrolysing)
MTSSRPLFVVVGTRPQVIKCAAMQHPHTGVDATFVDTGQHPSHVIRPLKSDLRIRIDRTLDAWDPVDTERRLGTLFAEAAPRAVVVVGDTLTTLAAARAAATVGCPLVHAEAGLGSRRPGHTESAVRLSVSRLATVNLCFDEAAAASLEESSAPGRVLVCADPHATFIAEVSRRAQTPGGEQAPAIVTVHKDFTFEGDAIASLIAALASTRTRAVLVSHARLDNALAHLGALPAGLERIDPQPPRALWALVRAAPFVVTDSGTLPREAEALGRRSVLLRDFSGNQALIRRGSACIGTTQVPGLMQAVQWARERLPSPVPPTQRSPGWRTILAQGLRGIAP